MPFGAQHHRGTYGLGRGVDGAQGLGGADIVIDARQPEAPRGGVERPLPRRPQLVLHDGRPSEISWQAKVRSAEESLHREISD